MQVLKYRMFLEYIFGIVISPSNIIQSTYINMYKCACINIMQSVCLSYLLLNNIGNNTVLYPLKSI